MKGLAFLRLATALRTAAVFTSLLAVIAIAQAHPSGSERIPAVGSDEQSAKKMLQWNFAVGDVLRIESKVTEIIAMDAASQFRNEKNYEYLWIVRDVKKNGVAEIIVRTERVHWRLENPAMEFDSRNDDVLVEPSEAAELRSLYYQARSMANTEFVCEVAPSGGIISMHGVVPPDAITYTPGDLPGLPESPIAVGDSWDVDFSSALGGFELIGTTQFRVAESLRKNGQTVWRIEGEAKPRVRGSVIPDGVKFSPTTTTSHFDPDAGAFLDEKMVQQFSLKLPTGEVASAEIEISRRLEKVEPMDTADRRSGEYMFAIQGETAHCVMLGGVKTRSPKDRPLAANQLLMIDFYQDWKDTDGDKIPSPQELTEATNRFSVSDPVRFVVHGIGLQNVKLRFNVLSGAGEEIVTNTINFVERAAYATRQLDLTEPGCYFFEFYLGDRYLVRIPILVTSESSSLSLQSATAYYRRGIASRAKGDLASALADYAEAIRLNPEFADAYNERGFVSYIQGDLNKAEADFTEAIRLAPKNHLPLLNRGNLWHVTGELDKALQDFTAAIRLNQRDPRALNNRGLVQAGRGEYQNALSDYAAAIQVDPQFFGPYNSRAWLRATCPDADHRDGVMALEDAKKACELTQWREPKVLDTLAAAYAENGDFVNAVKWQRKAQELVPAAVREQFEANLKLYLAGKPYREGALD